MQGRCLFGVTMTAAAGLCLLGAATSCMSERAAVPPQADFHVSTQGNDAWSGTLAAPTPDLTDGPFASLVRAQQAVRAKRQAAAATAPITVLVRGGTYGLDTPLVFGPEDSGTAAAPTVIAAWPDEKPVFSGGRAITGWQPGADGVWTVEIPEVKSGQWYFTQLFVNDARRQRARTPNTGFFRIDDTLVPMTDRDRAKAPKETKTGFRFAAGDVRRWDGWEDMQVVLFHSWTASIHWVADVNEAERTLQFTAPTGWPVAYWEPKPRYYIENVRAALDQPGEWYLDRKSGVLSYMPMPGETPASVTAVAPVLPMLVEFRSEPALGLWTEHITLRGLAFHHTAWELPHDQAHDGQAAVNAGAAVRAKGLRNGTLEQVEIAHVGAYGLWLARGCQDNRVAQCELRDLGAGGVMIGETGSPASDAEAAARNVVDNCFIHDGGHVYRAGIGAWIGRSSYNQLTHNEICDFEYSGVSVGWSWGYAASSANHNLVEYNHIHHLGQGLLSDMGGIYTLGVSPGTVLRGNVIHDVHAYSYGGWGLYTDEGSTDILMEKNVVYDTKSGGFHQHYGKENIVRHNILAFAMESEVIRSRQEEHISFTFEQNIVLTDNGLPLGGNWSNGNFRLNRNLYWDVKGNELVFAGMDLTEWRESGQDHDSVVADPLFVDAEKRDFRLKKGSPAAALGIEPLEDVSKAGLYGDAEWTRRALAVPHRAVDPVMQEPKLPKPAPDLIADDFEDTPVGEPAKIARTSGEHKGASIRVTDETAAAGGKHSLKFVDAAGLDHEWQPHLAYTGGWRRGTVCGAFDVRLEPGAILWHEWRDNANPYLVGPSLHFMGDGQVRAGKQDLVKVPLSTWCHVEIRTTLGKAATGTYDLTLTVAGTEPQRFPGLPCGKPEWRSLDWFGFVSEATEKTILYVDNVRFAVEKKPTP